MKITRRKTRTIKIGTVRIGSSYPIAIQSMAKSKTEDTEKTIMQIQELESAGCEIVRLAIRDIQDARAIKKIKPKINIPLVADIHFNWRLALEAIDNGADKIRLNPGNIYKDNEIKEIITALKMSHIPLRIGVNSGSARRLNSKKLDMPQRLVSSVLNYLKIVEKLKFFDIVISLKASNTLDTIEAYRKMAKLCDYPFHLGLTATGLPSQGAIKSSIALGTLLLEGIGDTLRISLTDNPEEEIKAAKSILESLGIRRFNPEIISCPTCGRCEVDLIKLVRELENKLSAINCKLLTVNSRPIRVALMGCVVNGPGEAKDADVGIAFGQSGGVLFKKGKPIRRIPFKNCLEILRKEMGEKYD